MYKFLTLLKKQDHSDPKATKEANYIFSCVEVAAINLLAGST